MKNQTRKTEHIYNDIKAKIITGELKSGDRLIETRYAMDYNASRLHVKEAFRTLESEQLAEYIPMRGVFVKGIDSNTLKEIACLRQALERVICFRVAEIAPQEDIEDLKKIANRFFVFSKNNMLDDSLEEVNKFYNTLYSICKYPRIVNILKTYSDYITLIRKLTVNESDYLIESADELNNMVEAIKNKNYSEIDNIIVSRHKHLNI